ncbi:uncharacterized protein BYT42DRAFT_52805 [Radiomyces spectabilis]|uniref:uncharacterized protein n=1 Tax=Radiomyces spectabilis TaxID=64574 RepID=UPI0022202EEC|nr:uncharacterized protein BYT42DRAFT_52805 [Radiomyces spectabilis]KAI8372935.1 hypothetical protein BYT42DRAFT_52805 [Radiomyces spectabilis]
MRTSPFNKRSNCVTPFTVKRKQVNFDLVDKRGPNNSSEASLASLLYKKDDGGKRSETGAHDQVSNEHQPQQQLEKTEKQLKEALHNERLWRHKWRLLENEREKFETSIKEQCKKDMQSLQLQLDILKKTHVEKVENMSATLSQLQKLVTSLRAQLKRHGIAEEYCEEERETVSCITETTYKEELASIQEAQLQSMDPMHQANQQLWSSIQKSTAGLRAEIDAFHTWRSLASVPVSELVRLAREDDRGSNSLGVGTLKKALFGRSRSGNKRKPLPSGTL